MARSGRPSKYTPKLASEICNLISQGISLRKICDMEGMPGRGTVLSWLTRESDFRTDFQIQYAQARKAQAYGWADEILDIADDSSGDTYTDAKGNEQTDWENVQRSRLRVDTRKWLLSKLLPKEYGDIDVDADKQKKPRTIVMKRSEEPVRLKQDGKDAE